MAILHVLGLQSMIVATRDEDLAQWLARDYVQVEFPFTSEAIERCVREASEGELAKLWRDAFQESYPEFIAPGDVERRLIETANSGRHARVICLKEKSRPYGSAELPLLPTLSQALVTDAPPGHIMWIGFELLDQAGNALAYTPFELRGPDGTVQMARLDREGRFRKDPTLDGTFALTVPQDDAAAPDPSPYVDLEILDGSGEPVPSAAFEVHVDGAVVQTGRTDESGRAHVAGLPAGSYTLVLPEFAAVL